MAGAYAHLTLVNLAREPARIEAGPGMPSAAALALGRWFSYCELGTLSPDYPYLDFEFGAAQWADLVHRDGSGDMIRYGIELVRTLTGTPREKAFAWLLGYTAHVIADATVHPVIEIKVGPYAQNKTAHRVCEMHQDAYVFQRMNLGAIGLSKHLDSGIGHCTASNGGIDTDIRRVWQDMLQTCYPDEAKTNPPDIDGWHRGFGKVVEMISAMGNRLCPIARHVAVNCGLSYPAAALVDHVQYLDQLDTPHGPLAYDAIFEKALRHVSEGWHLVADAVFAGGSAYQTAFWNWSLDTGKDASGRIVFWDENT
jgi:hypothetical protein